MNLYEKVIDGKTVIKTRKEIVIHKDGRVTYNPTEDMISEDGWVEYVEPTPNDGELLNSAKEHMIHRLHEFDESSEVNDCIIVYQGNELHYWADKHERDALKSAIRDYIALGRTKYRLDLRNIGISLWIPCEELLDMLAHLEVYATDCYNKTTDHEFTIKDLNTIEEVCKYDFCVGYPSIPIFEL